MTYKMNWDLDSIFPGGSSSVALSERLNQLKEQIATFQETVSAYQKKPNQKLCWKFCTSKKELAKV